MVSHAVTAGSIAMNFGQLRSEICSDIDSKLMRFWNSPLVCKGQHEPRGVRKRANRRRRRAALRQSEGRYRVGPITGRELLRF